MADGEMHYDGTDLFITREGAKIAKRGRPGTPQAGTWVSLEPGWQVFDGPEDPDGTGSLVITKDGVTMQ